jgi:carbonic anhydrase
MSREVIVMKNGTLVDVAVAVTVAINLTPVRALAQEAKAHQTHEWDYGREHGPEHWGDLKAEFATCRTGHRQSPIDIRKTEKADLPAIQFDYKASPLRIVDNGHTIMITYAPGSSIRVGDVTYELKQFHFHRPSETRLNGKTYDMELHLVHADEGGHLAVVAVLLQQGMESPLVRELWNDIPKDEGKEALLDSVQINAADLLPAGRGYYTFDGSLTTPPCSENVTWVVLKEPFQISAGEIALFSKHYPRDARPAQPAYDRAVKETK